MEVNTFIPYMSNYHSECHFIKLSNNICFILMYLRAKTLFTMEILILKGINISPGLKMSFLAMKQFGNWINKNIHGIEYQFFTIAPNVKQYIYLLYRKSWQIELKTVKDPEFLVDLSSPSYLLHPYCTIFLASPILYSKYCALPLPKDAPLHPNESWESVKNINIWQAGEENRLDENSSPLLTVFESMSTPQGFLCN